MPLAYRMPISTTTARSSESFSKCYALGGVTPVEVTREQCSATNQNSRNQSLCAGCTSPFRRCFACIQLGLLDYRPRSCNSSTGLCEFHTKNGIHAVPDMSETVQGDIATNPSFLKPPEAGVSSSPKSDFTRKRFMRVIPVVTDEVSEDELMHMAKLLTREFDRFTPIQKNVIRLYAAGKSTSEIAIELCTSPSTLLGINAYFTNTLKLPTFRDRDTQSRGHLRQQLIKKIYDLYEEALDRE